ncbi:MAG: hypothetical protein AB7J28_08010 [Hyphomonadaceae bacterium]
MLLIIGWVMLWFRASWGLLGFFSFCLAVLSGLLNYFRTANHPDAEGLPFEVVLIASAIDTAIGVAIFAAVGAIIVAVRGGKIERRSPTDAEIDAELARIRAEAAAREAAPSPAPPPAP